MSTIEAAQRISIIELEEAFQNVRNYDFEVTEIDMSKTLYLLQIHPRMTSIIKDYEYSQRYLENGFTQFEMRNAEGGSRFGEHGQETIMDVVADAVVLKEKSANIYRLYKNISSVIKTIITNLGDPHERTLCKLLFIDGMKYSDAVNYLDRGYLKDLYPISPTTFAEKRRRALNRIAESLKLIGVLLHIVEDNLKYKDKMHFAFI